MKPLIRIAVAASLSAAVALPATAQMVDVETMKSGDNWDLVFGSATATGSYFAGMSAMATVLSNMDNVRATATVSPNVATEVYPQMIRAERAGGMMTSYDVEMGYKGEGPHSGRDIPVMGWGFVQEALYNVFVLSGSGVETVADLKGSGLRIAATCTPVEEDRPERWDQAFSFFHALLTAHDVDPFSDVEIVPYCTSQAIDQLGAGNIDGLSASRGLGDGAIMELSTRQNVTLLQPVEDAIPAVEAAFPVYAQHFPPETYPEITVPDPQLAFFHGVYTVIHRDLPEDLVYDMTKAFWENIDVLRRAHPAFQIADLELALRGMPAPVHPGALRYYEEMGVEGVEDVRALAN